MSTQLFIVRYLMKRIKDNVLGYFYQLKSQLFTSVDAPPVPPLTLNIKDRLGHAADFQGMMEQPDLENNNTDEYVDDALNLEFANRTTTFEFVTTEGDYQTTETNWDLNNAENNNPDSVVVEVDPFMTYNTTNNEETYPDLIDPPEHGNENIEKYNFEMVHTTSDLPSRGIVRFTFKINNISDFARQPNTLYSEEFLCRDFPFKLVVRNKAHELALSAFIAREKSDNQLYDSGVEICAACDIGVYDQIVETCRFNKSFVHSFRAGGDWGFPDFLDKDCAQALGTGALLHDSLVIKIQMKADPPCCYNFSRAITNCVGIRNQGATCYMNSLLQVLFFLTKFRTACYRIPTEMDANSSMALALQKVFYNLEFSNYPVCTKSLTKSFGWSTGDVLMQHDVQEMMRVLIDKIESRMKNTLLEPILPSIFQGKFVSYVKCRDIEFSSQREEVFYDIQLSLEKTNNVIDSFRQYVSPELMDDDNKYHAGSHGLQAAEKGTLFMSLPPVLFLHLLRFQFDVVMNQVMKNNNYFEFSEHLDLTEFVREDESSIWKYTLFAVLSHSGNGSHGHYVAYINPSLKGQWFKFDDDKISIVMPHDAIDSNFGSSSEVDEWTKSTKLNAYMLVYVRDSLACDVFEPTDPMYICDEMKSVAMCDPVEQSYNNLKKHVYTADVFVILNTVLEADGIFNSTKHFETPKFSVQKNFTTNEFKMKLLSPFHLNSTDQIRVWRIVHKTPLAHPAYLREDDLFIHALETRDYLARPFSPPLTVWLEMALPGEVLPPFDPDLDVLVFYHYYCAKECRQMYVHHGYHNKYTSIAELIPIFNQVMEWSNCELNIYQIHRGTKAVELDVSGNFMDYLGFGEHTCGTHLMYVAFEPKQHDVSTKLNSISLYYQDLLLRALFVVCNIDNSKDEVVFELSQESTFPEFLAILARHLNYDKKKIQIFTSHCNTPVSPVPSSTTAILKTLFECHNDKVQSFFKLHTVDVIVVETKHNFTFQWVSIDLKKQSRLTIYLSDDETIESILAAAKQIIDADQTNGSGMFRILAVYEDHLRWVDDIKDIYNFIESVKEKRFTAKAYHFRIEEIPKGDESLNENELYVPVFQTRSNSFQYSRPGNFPFMFKVDMNESWQRIKERLRTRLNVSEKNWSDYSPEISTLSSSEDWDMQMEDDKCLNDIVQQPGETFTICLNKTKSRRSSNKSDVFFMSLC